MCGAGGICWVGRGFFFLSFQTIGTVGNAAEVAFHGSWIGDIINAR